MLGFLAGIRFARDFKRQIEGVQSRLQASWRPHVELIVGMNIVVGLLFSVLAVGLTCVMLWPTLLPQFPVT